MNETAADYLTRRIADMRARIASKMKDIESVNQHAKKWMSRGDIPTSDFQTLSRLAAECGALAESIGELETVSEITK